MACRRVLIRDYTIRLVHTVVGLDNMEEIQGGSLGLETGKGTAVGIVWAAVVAVAVAVVAVVAVAVAAVGETSLMGWSAVSLTVLEGMAGASAIAGVMSSSSSSFSGWS